MEDNDRRPQQLAEEKYITFKTTEFFEMCGTAFMPPYYHRDIVEAKLHDRFPHLTPHDIKAFAEELTGTNEDCAPIAEHLLKTITNLHIEDAVVIRRQDSFAPPALDAYANSIQVALEVDEKFTAEPNPRAQHLRNVADYFHEQAAKSWQAQRKIPD